MEGGRRRAIVIAGGECSLRELNEYCTPSAIVLAVDGGLYHLLAANLFPDALIGDLDTLDPALKRSIQDTNIPIHILPHDKDISDTHAACRLAITIYQANEIILLGAWGGPRADHAMANVMLLEWLERRNIRAVLLHPTNRFRLLRGPGSLWMGKNGGYTHISLLPLTDTVQGIVLEGFQYPLDGAALPRAPVYGLSNRLIAPFLGRLSIQFGACLVIESQDQDT
ncbi:thiamine diphosphokinase [Pasteuria penetrans]|uniref:thiamine diphosphokinase n=1 Tax=Pasteuria penetrans TaxID=86005 RepID=UPI000F9DC112|nr:thiamine diphosphokinase [Pasteuria penetrans]